MNKDYWDLTRVYYTVTHLEHPGEPQGVDWSAVSQKKRFEVMVRAIKDKDARDTILDVGCGYGDLVEYIDWTSNYHGIDLNPKMIDVAKKRRPNFDFRVTNLEEFEQSPGFDWVLASGAFNLKAKNNQMIVQEAIKSMWLLCNKGIVFNVLIEGSDIRNENMHFYDPGIVLNYCRTLTPLVNCRMDYLPHDATYCLYRE